VFGVLHGWANDHETQASRPRYAHPPNHKRLENNKVEVRPTLRVSTTLRAIILRTLSDT